MKFIVSFAFIIVAACGVQQKQPANDKKWISLFNGKDINDWVVKIHHHDPGVNFGNTFRVEDGLIKVRYDQYGAFNNQFGHLYYKQPFSYTGIFVM